MAVYVDPLEVLPSPLARLNYFDGLFLRAELLRREQSGMRSLVFESNLAGGAGIAFGLDASMAGDTITVQPGLAIDGQGRVLLLVDRAEASLRDLLGERTPARQYLGGSASFAACEDLPAPPASGTSGGTALYAIVLRHGESACGWEEVRGRACEDACDAATERPYIVETARIGLCRITLTTPLPRSQAVVLHDVHLRAQVAAAFYADERARAASLVFGAGIRSTVWCRGAVDVAGICGDDVPIAVIAVRDGARVFLDPWIVRRERMDTPPHSYWAGRMAMRPWDVYLAQVLQFQCQLAELLGGKGDHTPLLIDPRGDARELLGQTLTLVEALGKGIQRLAAPEAAEEGELAARRPILEVLKPLDFQLAGVGGLKGLPDLGNLLRDAFQAQGFTRQLLIDGGFVELPPAGYLPVDPQATTALTEQVADLLGPGLELRFCAVRADQMAGEFESCQHLDRISLLRGIDDPARRELVDILVPDGEVGAATAALTFEVDLAISPERVRPERELVRVAALSRLQIPLQGVARVDAARHGPFALYVAVAGGVATPQASASASGWIRNTMRGRGLRRRPNFGDGTMGEVGLARVVAAVRSAGLREVLDEPLTVPPPPVGGDGEPIVGWLELRLDGNPFTAGLGNGGLCSVTALLYIPARSGSVGGIEANGRYRVERILSPTRVQVVVSGQAIIREGGPTPPAQALDLSFVLDRTDGSLTVSDAVEAALAWGGSPLAATADLHVPGLAFAVGAEARQSDTADDAGDLYHDKAMMALTILEGAQGAGFVEEAAGKLFGRRTGGGEVRTPLDWVLFRRRTRRDCGEAEAPPVEDHRVDGWHIEADGRSDGERIWEALQQGEFDERWRPFATAVFAGDSAQLRTSAAQLRSRWADPNVRGGNVLLFGAYAGTGAATQPAARDRLRNLVRALNPAAVLEGLESNALRLIGPPPNEFVNPGSDGAVFLISLQSAELCADVYAPAHLPDDDLWVEIVRPLVNEVQAAIDRGRLVRIGTMISKADGTYELGGTIERRVAGKLEVPVVVWAHADWINEGNTADYAQEFAGEGLRQAGASVDVLVKTAEFAREKCPVRVFVWAADPADG